MPHISAEIMESHIANAQKLRIAAYGSVFAALLRRADAIQKAIAARLHTPSSTHSTAT